ncbi:MAG: hypothetical protein D6729_16955 [Deltaproteobacteria bacterium]|nr:MAG: hypothetical protein D6729_16955 [Deltaproteobacteria bacterium]
MARTRIIVVDSDDGARTALVDLLCLDGYRAAGCADTARLEATAAALGGVDVIVSTHRPGDRRFLDGLVRWHQSSPETRYVPISADGDVVRPLREAGLPLLGTFTQPIEYRDLLAVLPPAEGDAPSAA